MSGPRPAQPREGFKVVADLPKPAFKLEALETPWGKVIRAHHADGSWTDVCPETGERATSPMPASESMVQRIAHVLALKNGQLRVEWTEHAEKARAVIEAMREPSIDMEIAGTEGWLTKRDMEGRALACWQAMIDEALK